MTVKEAIKELQRLQNLGYGDAKLRNYSVLADEPYPPAKFVLHTADEDLDESIVTCYGTWVEVL